MSGGSCIHKIGDLLLYPCRLWLTVHRVCSSALDRVIPWLQPTHSSAMTIKAYLWTCLPWLHFSNTSGLLWFFSILVGFYIWCAFETILFIWLPQCLRGSPHCLTHPIACLFSSSYLTNHGQYGCPKTVSFRIWELTWKALPPMQVWWTRCVCLPGLGLAIQWLITYITAFSGTYSHPVFFFSMVGLSLANLFLNSSINTPPLSFHFERRLSLYCNNIGHLKRASGHLEVTLPNRKCKTFTSAGSTSCFCH